MKDVFQEFISCQRDFVYFVTNYVQIIHPIKGLIPFELYDYQKRLISEYETHRYVAVIKFRQGGFSTLTVLYGLWKCMFHPNYAFYFGCRTEREAAHLGKLVDITLQRFPDWFAPKMSKHSKSVKAFAATGSRMYFGHVEGCRGKHITHLVLDEAAFIENLEDKWQNLWPTLSTGASVFAVSTTNGVGNWFEQIWRGAQEGTNQFYPCHISYYEHPDYNNPAWVDEMKKNLGEKGWHQEVLGDFVVDEPFPDHDFSGLDTKALAAALGRLCVRRRISEMDRALIYEAAIRLTEISCANQPDPPAKETGPTSPEARRSG